MRLFTTEICISFKLSMLQTQTIIPPESKVRSLNLIRCLYMYLTIKAAQTELYCTAIMYFEI